ncbi:MAG TPA: protease complex subunit PrcB family protein [Rubrobacteraceae bacterium]|nr:protease complex subunit PrcB family protein [Rubrobacteraceae bacterium]
MMLRAGTILLLILLAAGCAAGGGSGSSPEGSNTTSQESTAPSTTQTQETTESSMERNEISLEQIAANAPGQGPKRPKVVVASSADALSKALGPKAKIPDSGEGIYLAAFWGQKPTGGFSMAARSARGEGGKVMVGLALKRPPKDAFVAQVLTYPYVVAVVRGAPADAEFVFVDQGGRKLGWPLERAGG